MTYFPHLNAAALRQARRDRQLVSKRLLLNEDEEQPEASMDTTSGEQVSDTCSDRQIIVQ